MPKVKKYFLPITVVFVVVTVFNMIFHGMLMEKVYMHYSHFFRPHNEICKHKLYMWLGNLIYAAAFYYIYTKGHEGKKDIVQGMRYGIWISLLIWVPQAIINYTVYPYPKSLVLAWLVGYTVQSIIAGIVASLVYAKVK